MMGFIRWLLRLISFGALGKSKQEDTDEGTTTDRQSNRKSKTIVTLLIYPRIDDTMAFGETTQVGDDTYFVSSPWLVSGDKINQVIGDAENWLAEALGVRIAWEGSRTIDSHRTLSEWRSQGIHLIKEEVELQGQPWSDDHVYLAFVRGMGGYAGGIGYQDGNAGYAMVGDICLEAICEYPEPTSGSVLLEQPPWQPNAYSSIGQTGALIHEALHGLGLPHPNGWPDGDQPGEDETIMGHWWNMPNFNNTKGLTQREVDKVLKGIE
jgi:hypothetical protein